MSGGSYSSVRATFRNKKIVEFLKSCFVTEQYWDIYRILYASEREITLVEPDEGMIGLYYTIKVDRTKRKNYRPEGIYEETNTYQSLDLAKVFGLRDTLYCQKNDKCLTRADLDFINESFREVGLDCFFRNGKGRISREEERKIRLTSCDISYNKKGEIRLDLDDEDYGYRALALLVFLSRKFPKTKIKLVTEFADYDYEWSSGSKDIYIIKNGNYRRVNEKSSIKKQLKRAKDFFMKEDEMSN